MYSTVVGVARRLCPVIEDELRAVGKEAIRNALVHADARTLDIHLAYSWRGLVVEIRDDGGGIGPEVLANGGRPGHWGIPGMNERMAGIGGSFEVASASGKGTGIRMEVPARAAFLGRFAIDWATVRSSWG